MSCSLPALMPALMPAKGASLATGVIQRPHDSGEGRRHILSALPDQSARRQALKIVRFSHRHLLGDERKGWSLKAERLV
jgi:hypothetical protein